MLNLDAHRAPIVLACSVEGRFCGVPVQREGVVGVNGTVSKTNSCRTPANPEGSHDCDLKVLESCRFARFLGFVPRFALAPAG